MKKKIFENKYEYDGFCWKIEFKTNPLRPYSPISGKSSATLYRWEYKKGRFRWVRMSKQKAPHWIAKILLTNEYKNLYSIYVDGQ